MQTKNKYYELTITVQREFTELVADFISNIIDEGLEIEKDIIVVKSEKNPLPLIQNVVGNSIPIDYKLELKDYHDWIFKYQNSIEPIEVGKFYIHPSWYEAKEGKINIKIDPALAFGSGHHATTSLCLEAIDRYVNSDHKVLDVGCGSGILGLACQKVGATVELCDVDPIAVDSCKKNFLSNHATIQRIWKGSVDDAKGKYDIVLANIVTEVLKSISNNLKSVIANNGILILAGITKRDELDIKDTYQELNLIEQKPKDEWVTLIYRKK